MDIDASRVPVDDADRRPAADLPAAQQADEPPARVETRLPSAAERVDAFQQARLAVDKAYAKWMGEEISKGHAFDKHVVEQGEFPGVTTREQFATVVENAVLNGESRTLRAGRAAYWDDGTVVIRNSGASDGGTAFRPEGGYDYFLRLD